MKDLRLKIISDFVKGGFDRAQNAVESLKGQFATIREGGSKAWGLIAAGAATAGVVMYKVGERLRQSWLADMDRMRNAAAQFAEDVNKNFRKIRFQDTESEKALNLEKIDNKLREYRNKIEKLQDEMATKSIAGNVMDLGEKTVRKIAGHGFTEASEVELRRAKEEMGILERQRVVSASKETNDAKKAALEKKKAIIAAEKEWMDENEKGRAALQSANQAVHDREMEWAKEEAGAWKESFDAKVKAAMDAAEKIARIRALAEGVNDVRREIAYEAATPEQRQAMDKAKLREIKAQAMEKNALGDFVRTPEDRADLIKEGLRLQAKIMAFVPPSVSHAPQETDSADHLAPRHRGGLRSRGGHIAGRIGSFRGARMSESVGPTVAPVDEHLIVAKQSLDTLKRIEKKTGAAP